MDFKLIVAVSDNSIIGNKNKLPWSYSEDLKYFKEITSNGNNVLIMGRKTFESLPPLKNRDLIVLSNSFVEKVTKNTHIFSSTEKMFTYLNSKQYDNHFIIGGSSIFKLFLTDYQNLVSTIYYTKINKFYDGDVTFPNISLEKFYTFSQTQSSNHPEIEYIVYKKNNTVYNETQYLHLIEHVMKNGNEMLDRTNIGTLSCFGESMKFDLQYGFPLLTSKKMFVKGIIEELLWFLSGKTDSSLLEKKGVNIWKENTSRDFLDSLGFNNRNIGDAGPIYGFQFRHSGADYINCNTDYSNQGIDQLQNVIHLIKTQPSSRRILINLWDVSKLNEMVLPPCHMIYHFKVEKDRLSCVLYQRSGDLGLGIPFNIASASLLISIIAKLTNLQPGILTHFIGDAHIYINHLKQLESQLQNPLYPFPQLVIKDRQQQNIEDFVLDDFLIKGYRSNNKIGMKMAV